MALSHSPSENQSQAETQKILSQEAQSRINIVATNAIAILDKDTDLAIQKTFLEMISGNLRDPENIMKIQNWLYKARDARLEEPGANRLDILNRFSQFMNGFAQNTAHMQRDIAWSNDIQLLTRNADQKTQQVKDTYARILNENHSEIQAA
jgi:hypothetical protein